MTVTTAAPLDIPIIDISDEYRAAKDLVHAASRYGFVFIKNGGEDDILQPSINDMFGLVIYV